MSGGTGDLFAQVRRLTLSRRTEALVFLVPFVVFVATASRDYLCLDVFSSNFASWRLATSGSPFVDGASIPHLGADHPLRWVWVQDHAPNGHSVITRSPAVVLAGLPAYLVSQPQTMTVLPAAVTAAALTALAVLLMFLAMRTVLSTKQSATAAAAFAFTTPVWSVAANGIWPQTISVLGIAMLAWATATERWWTMGVAGVLLLAARPHAALIVAILGLWCGWRERRLGIVLRAGIPGVVGLALISVWTRWVYGSWDPTALYGAGALAEVSTTLFDLTNQAGMWVAPDRGILVFTPVLLVILPTLVRSWPTLPDWTRTLLLAGLGYTVLQSALISFIGGDPVYGYRYGLEFLACATPAFAVAACRMQGMAARLLAPILTLQLVVIMLGAVVERTALPYTDVWVDNAFVHAMAHAPVSLPVLTLSVVAGSVLVERLVRLRLAQSGTAGVPARASTAVPVSPRR